MIPAAGHTSVLVVGAGPSGLMMAAQLLRHGIQPVIIDQKKGPTDQSKALAVQARSMEIYRQMGLVARVLNESISARNIVMNDDGREVGKLWLNDIGDGFTPYQAVYMYPQNKNERLLLDNLTLNCCPVYWNITLTSLTNEQDGCHVVLQSEGVETNLTCSWVIGADGSRSTVRDQLNIPFKGDTYAHDFYLADVSMDQDTDGEIQLFLAKEGFAAFFPMPEQKRFRIVGRLPAGLTDVDHTAIKVLLPYLEKVTGGPLKIIATHWLTIYKLHHRMAEQFRSQRCFLIGDAAHIHSPVGGQGMNTGLQDAYNLAWKLAGVINKQYSIQILDSYAAERMPVAASLLKATDRAFNFILSNSLWNRLIKKWLLPVMIKKVWGNEGLRRKFFIRISQTGIKYRDSKLSLHLSQANKIKAGDRLPYLKIFDEKKLLETDLHEWCTKPGFTFIALGHLGDEQLFRLARWITQTYAGILNFYYLPPSNKNRPVFDAFEMTANQQKTLIVRPDMYIGFMNDSIDTTKIDSYMKGIVGVKT